MVDLVFTCMYPKPSKLLGDYFGREGLCHFLGIFLENMDTLDMNVEDVCMVEDRQEFTISGTEKFRHRYSGEIVSEKFIHRVQYGPTGSIIRLHIEADLQSVTGDWQRLECKNPYPVVSTAAIRSNRSLSVSLKDFTVYNVIGKGGFGTVCLHLILNAILLKMLVGGERGQKKWRADLRHKDLGKK